MIRLQNSSLRAMLLAAAMAVSSIASANEDLSPDATVMEETDAGEHSPAFAELRERFRTADNAERAKLLPQIEEIAAKGNHWAMLLVGDAYARGEGTDADRARAISLYEDAAKAGNVFALTRLGEIYRDGFLAKADPARAISYYQQAVDAGSKRAAVILGESHMNYKFGRLSNPHTGFRLLQDALAASEPTAASALANAYIWARGIARNPSKALQILAQSADAGNAAAARALIAHHRAGRWTYVRRDLSRAQSVLDKYAPILSETELAREKFLMRAASAPSRNFAALADEIDKFGPAEQAETISALRAANANAYVYVAQRRLKEKGLYKGALDGRLTRETIRAINTLCRQSPTAGACEEGPLDARAAQMIARLVSG